VAGINSLANESSIPTYGSNVLFAKRLNGLKDRENSLLVRPLYLPKLSA